MKKNHLFGQTAIPAISCFVIFGKVRLVRHGMNRYEWTAQALQRSTQFPASKVNPLGPVHEFTWDSTNFAGLLKRITKQLAKHTEQSMVLGVWGNANMTYPATNKYTKAYTIQKLPW